MVAGPVAAVPGLRSSREAEGRLGTDRADDQPSAPTRGLAAGASVSVSNVLALALSVVALTGCAEAPPVSSLVAAATVGDPRLALTLTDFISPSGAEPRTIARVYTLVRSAEGDLLMARHDAVRRHDGRTPPPAVHYGHVFAAPPPLATQCLLSWRWRVLLHPDLPADDDPWDDVAASLYVVFRRPTLLRSGDGFKLGWLVRDAPPDTRQHGLIQIAIERGPADVTWRAERVDLCALYRRYYGPVGDARILYVGVLTDADDTRSVAAADYAELALGGAMTDTAGANTCPP